ncbi:MAG TPA: ABC transporter permease [Anaerolineaceae bacterium]|jgi:simple sugar transport system permease protein|nr:ABC transporter permease [Anaerolineaceae bacterium]HOR84526.1 ABC transporter permease [Anaerolineaceae bacterium]HPL42521.1 ABC transporter permease [Anaerolineaceae bacterium]
MSSDKRLFLFNFLRGAAAILLALLVATVFIFLSSKQPLTSLKYLLLGPVISFKSTGAVFNTTSFLTLLAAMIPTIFSGLAVCVMFSANQFNLAGEGVIMLGAFVGGLLGIYLKLNTGLHQVVCVLVAAIVGGLIMLIPALLKVKLGASEMVTSLMLNYVIMFVILHFLNFTFADRSKGATQSFPFQATAKIPEIVANGTKLTWGLVIALVFVVIIALFMYRTKWGYAIRMIGINQAFAQYSGIQVGAIIVLSQVVGGILAGMGGSIEMLGRYNTFIWRELPGYGWLGITIAILAKNNPIFVPVAALFIAYLDKGCQLMAINSDVPFEMIDIIQASIFLFFAAEQFLAKYRQRIVVRIAQRDLALQEAAAGQEGSKS